MLLIDKTTKIATGATRLTDWQQYGGESKSGIYVDVDTSVANFTKTPVYMTSLHGFTHHWSTTGATSVYNASPTGFRIYVRLADGGQITPADASSKGWNIQWVGIED